jgi:hypothetical protein
VLFTASVSPVTATGTVTFKDGARVAGTGAVVSGKAHFTTATLSPGTHSITAAYDGNNIFLASTSRALSQVVNKASTKATVVSSHNPSVFGQSVTFTASVIAVAPGKGMPVGTVTFKNGGAVLSTQTLSGGKAAFSTSALTPGTHSITVMYNGSGDFGASTSAVQTQTVNKASSLTRLTSTSNPSRLGQTVTFTLTVSTVAPGTGVPTGSVALKNGSATIQTATLVNGRATISTSALGHGTHDMKAVYSGSTNELARTSTVLTQTVN